MTRQTILYITGLSGAGKSRILELLKGYGIRCFYTGDIGRELLGPAAPKEKIAYGDFFRKEYEYIALVMEHVLRNKNLSPVIVLDSLRSEAEWTYVQSLPYESKLLAVVCSKSERWRRLKKRDGTTWRRVHTRDSVELGRTLASRFNVQELLGVADYYVNTSATIDETKHQIEDILRDVEHTSIRRNRLCSIMAPGLTER